ncbi:hypothetical protein CHS0354_028902 [Potamilus streckersoni]|uniref:Uncharacterized protein n=1 Tax=Potamilus streckersoni TaxID=2493646 RepID=A0AAE0VSS3_9BIVA|nr:hypothetical protein CHS0354_028902 [Potamilus streckersoni]
MKDLNKVHRFMDFHLQLITFSPGYCDRIITLCVYLYVLLSSHFSENYTESLKVTDMITVPVESIDKKFKDLSKQYNDVMDADTILQLEIHNLKLYFVVETSGIPVLKECLKILASRCGVAKIKIERKSKTFLEVSYDPEDVSENCTVSPELVLEPLRHYKTTFNHAKVVLQHTPDIKEKISVIINDKQTMLKEIAEVDPMRDGGAEGMKAIMSNIKKLKQMNLNINDVQQRTEQTCRELIDASKSFCV